MKKNSKITAWIILIVFACPQLFAGGAPDSGKPKAAKIIIRDEGVSPISLEAGGAVSQATSAKNAAGIGGRDEMMISSGKQGLFMNNKTVTKLRETEERTLATLQRNMFDWQVERLLRSPDRKRDMPTLFGRDEKWEYYGMGYATTVTLTFHNGRLVDVKKKPEAAETKPGAGMKKANRETIIPLEK